MGKPGIRGVAPVLLGLRYVGVAAEYRLAPAPKRRVRSGFQRDGLLQASPDAGRCTIKLHLLGKTLGIAVGDSRRRPGPRSRKDALQAPEADRIYPRPRDQLQERTGLQLRSSSHAAWMASRIFSFDFFGSSSKS